MARRAHYEFMSGMSHNTMVAMQGQDTSLASLQAEIDAVELDVAVLEADAAMKDEHNVFTEPQTIDVGAADADLHIASDDGFYASWSFEGTGNLSRWSIAKTAALGYDLAISRFDDAGVLIDSPIIIDRQTGVVDFEEMPTVDGVPISGGGVGTFADLTLSNTFTAGPQIINTNASEAFFEARSDAGVNAGLRIRSDSATRWIIRKDTIAESGANAGSGLQISRYDDAGSIIDTPIAIARDTGIADFEHTPTVDGNALAMASALAGYQPLDDGLTRISTFLTPEQFGATGGADDTSAVQDFFDALCDTANSVGFLSRWYNIVDTIIISTSAGPWRCFGTGRYTSGLRVNDSAFTLHLLGINDMNDFQIDNFGLDGGRTSELATGVTHALRIENCDDFIVSRFFMYDWGTGSGAFLQDCERGQFTDFHMNGTNETGNGLLVSDSPYFRGSGGFVENVNNESTCHAYQFKGASSHSVIENCVAANCFAGFTMHGSDDATPLYARDSHFKNIHVYNPSGDTTAGAGVFSVGLRFWNCADCTATDVTIDGNDLDEFVAIQLSNGDETGPTVLKGNGLVRAAVFNCNGTDSYVLRHEAPRTMVYLDQVVIARNQPILFNSDAIDGKIIIGRRSANDIFAPWRMLDTSGGIGTNMTIEMVTPAVRYISLTDDTMFELAIPDADSGILTVWTGNPDEQFQGWARVTAFPDFDSFHTGAEVTVGTTLLTSATDGSTVDTDLNIAISNNLIQVSNRRGGTREVGIKFEAVN